MRDSEIIEGQIKSFNGEYGFIAADDASIPDVFLHASVLAFCRQECPLRGDQVRFKYCDKEGRLVVRWIEIIG